jgi:hypothetical protein
MAPKWSNEAAKHHSLSGGGPYFSIVKAVYQERKPLESARNWLWDVVGSNADDP